SVRGSLSSARNPRRPGRARRRRERGTKGSEIGTYASSSSCSTIEPQSSRIRDAYGPAGARLQPARAANEGAIHGASEGGTRRLRRPATTCRTFADTMRAMGEYLAAIDQGTTGTRCILFDLMGRPVASAYREHEQIFPRPGWVEHDPLEIRERVDEVVFEGRRGGPRGRVFAVGATNQRETVVAWNRRDGSPAANAIVWQDTRTADACRAAIEQGWDEDVRRRTGLPISTYFSATKFRWLLENEPQVRALLLAGDLCFGTVDSWVIWHLTGGPRGGAFVTDPTTASRTPVGGLGEWRCDPGRRERFRIPARAPLPTILPSIAREPYGHTAADGPFGERVPVCGDLGDQQAALAGQGCFAPGEAKNTYGTGSFLLQHVGREPRRSASGLLATPASSPPAPPASP